LVSVETHFWFHFLVFFSPSFCAAQRPNCFSNGSNGSSRSLRAGNSTASDVFGQWYTDPGGLHVAISKLYETIKKFVIIPLDINIM
jgi:hypothetical protein